MPNHHQATPDEWAQQSDWAADRRSSASSCIVELRGRIEALEAAQRFNAGLTEADIKAAELAWARTAPGMRSDDVRPVAAGAQVGRSSAAFHQMLALQDRIQEGTLTLAEALEEINGEPEPAADAQQLTLVERVAEAIVANAGPIPAHGHAWTPEARAAIRVVAEWLRAGALSDWGLAAADLLDNEATNA